MDDGCFNNGKTGWGCVIKDHRGGCVIFTCRREDISIELVMARLMELNGAFKLVATRQFSHILNFLLTCQFFICCAQRHVFIRVYLFDLIK